MTGQVSGHFVEDEICMWVGIGGGLSWGRLVEIEEAGMGFVCNGAASRRRCRLLSPRTGAGGEIESVGGWAERWKEARMAAMWLVVVPVQVQKRVSIRSCRGDRALLLAWSGDPRTLSLHVGSNLFSRRTHQWQRGLVGATGGGLSWWSWARRVKASLVPSPFWRWAITRARQAEAQRSCSGQPPPITTRDEASPSRPIPAAVSWSTRD